MTERGATAGKRLELYKQWAGKEEARWVRVQQLEESSTDEQLGALEWVMRTLEAQPGVATRPTTVGTSVTEQALLDFMAALDHFVVVVMAELSDYMREVMECLRPPMKRVVLAATLSLRYPRLARLVCWVVKRLPRWVIMRLSIKYPKEDFNG